MQDALKTGTRLHNDTYEIIRVLGQGGFGITYEAKHLILNRRVAIKELFVKNTCGRGEDNKMVVVPLEIHKELFESQRKKFIGEARKMAQLRNNHIVTVHAFFDENATSYFEMDYVEGQSLRDWLNLNQQPLDEDTVRLVVLKQMLEALEFIHSQTPPLYHLDIKPENILVTPNGSNIVLVDFGASKYASHEGGANLSSMVVYTPGYAPLEQLGNNVENIGPWSDFYSLGATMYTMLTGYEPNEPADILNDPSPTKENTIPIPQGLGDQMKQLILWMMEPDKAERPQSVKEIREFLDSPQPRSLSPIGSSHDSYADFCYEDARLLLDRTGDVDVLTRYDGAYRLLMRVLNHQTMDSALVFSGPYAKLDYVARKTECPNLLLRRMNAFRCRGVEKGREDVEALDSHWLYDMKALCLFIENVYHAPVPDDLLKRLPATFPTMEQKGMATECIRGVVTRIEGEMLFLQPIDNDSREVAVCCSEKDHHFGDFSYILSLVKQGMRVNVVKPTLKDGVYHPQLLIVMPDMLINVSSIAACFESYANTHLAQLIKMLSPSPNSQAILLGNFAGQLLDEAIHNGAVPLPYQKSVLAFFKHSAMKIATCPDMGPEFHKEAKAQQQNICKIVKEQLPEMTGFDLEKVLLEPSFFSEMLGLQGRMDLLQSDMKVLVEQKSGKMFWLGGHQEKHYVQVLLYQALLHYEYDIPNHEIGTCLLYSKSANGLIKEGPAPKLLFEAFAIRNRMVVMMANLAQGKGRQLLESLTPESLVEKQMNANFWNGSIRPKLDSVLSPIHNADNLTKSYFYRMLTFVAKEHILAKVGTPGNEASGLASLWNASIGEKRSAGNILDNLVIGHLTHDGEEGITEVTLRIDDEIAGCLPNFRVADAVVLYSYQQDALPNPTRTMVTRGAVRQLEPHSIVVQLKAPQKNESVFKLHDDAVRWAVEHDFMEASFTTLYRSVASILSATTERRKLLLAQRTPRCESGKTVALTKPADAELIRRFLGAKDYFLLIGPPGTGKTSIGLVAMLQEELAQGGSVLLLSYTNRAVNEICSKLVEKKMDFLRLGNPMTCPECFHPYLLGVRAEKCRKVEEVKNMITTARVMVGTTSTMLTNIDLFALRSFSLAIVDEASQILEPHLLGILCAKNEDGDAIRRFVLIGDHKQLPAVVQQTERDSAVVEKELLDIGLDNCRFSLFERLLKANKGKTNLVYHFTLQGRMHHDVAGFANMAFYKGMLDEVPLQHQRKDLSFNHVDMQDAAQRLLASHRLLFIASHEEAKVGMEKVNEAEARVIARMVHAVYCLYGKDNGRTFSPDETVGVIVPYRHQIATIMRHLEKYDIPELMEISIDTVERFQGSQRDVIIYGFTVQKPWQLDFLTANVFMEDGKVIDRKLNVALTRAKEQMILVGDPKLLQRVDLFARLIEYCQTNGSYHDNTQGEMS
ncbi:MAG: protein kinase [Prevotella sp.]|nr:protein kinase [Prevotella sp.]